MNLSGPAGFYPHRVGRRPIWPYRVNKLSPQFNGLVAWFPLVNGTSDERLNGAHGTTDAAVAWTADVTVGPIANFDGVDTTLITYDVNTAFQLAGDATFAFWLQPKSGVTYAGAGSAADTVFGHLGAGEGQPENALYYVYLTDQDASNARLNIGWETGSGTNTDIAFTTNITKGVTSHIALLRDSSAKTVALYVNGILVETSSAYTNNPDGGTTGTLGIGGLPTGGTGCSMFITDLRLYNLKVADGVIRQMYEASTRWQMLSPVRGKAPAAKRGAVTQTQSLAGTLTTAGAITTGVLHKRLYFDSTASASASPSFDGGWSSTTGAVRRRLNHVKGTSLLAEGSTISWANPANTKALDRQYLSGPLSGAQAISGTVKMQLLVTQLNLADNVNRLFLAVKVVSIDGGTVRGTLLSHGNYGPTAEFNCELYFGTGGGFVYRNKTGADGDALTLVNALDGDRILVEIGYSNSTAGSTPEARAIYGEFHDATATAGVDLPEDETTTDPAFDPADPPHSGWIEFSTSLLFREPTAQTLGGAPVIAGNVIKQVGKIL